jgi:DNA-binding GntR family transcriptional regulator
VSDGPYDTLRTAILGFDFLPGEKLSERGLEEFLGVSRTLVRAAFVRLENEGLTARNGRGWQVTPIDLAEIRAVAEHREIVEAGAAALAVARATEDGILAVQALAAEPAATDEQAGLRHGSDFHLALVRLSGNPFLVDAMSGALTRLARTRWLEVRTASSRALARAEHLRILEAVGDRDADRVVELVRAHSRGTAERLLTHLGEERRRLRGRGFAIVDTSDGTA